jgi:hypothetical protein
MNHYVYAWGCWFCLVSGWVRSPDQVHGTMHRAVAEIVLQVQPGVVLVEVSA